MNAMCILYSFFRGDKRVGVLCQIVFSWKPGSACSNLCEPVYGDLLIRKMGLRIPDIISTKLVYAITILLTLHIAHWFQSMCCSNYLKMADLEKVVLFII